MTRSELIKQNAISLIASSGFASVSLRHLARESGIQAGSVYCHYASKEELLQEIIHEHLQGFLLVWQRSRRTRRPPQLALRKFVSLYCNYTLSNLKSNLIAELDFRSLEETGLNAVMAFKRDIEIELATILEEGRRSGAFGLEHARSTAAAIISLISGLCNRQYFATLPDDSMLSRQLEAFVASMVIEKAGIQPAATKGAHKAPSSIMPL